MVLDQMFWGFMLEICVGFRFDISLLSARHGYIDVSKFVSSQSRSQTLFSTNNWPSENDWNRFANHWICTSQVRKLKSILQSRDNQFKHETKKRERELTNLKERAQQLLTDRNKASQLSNMEISKCLTRSDGRRSKWRTESSSNRSVVPTVGTCIFIYTIHVFTASNSFILLLLFSLPRHGMHTEIYYLAWNCLANTEWRRFHGWSEGNSIARPSTGFLA